MSEFFLGQIQPFAFNFAPSGWALCNGQLLSINQNQALFSLLGTTYGGNGQTTFALPNLQSRVPIHPGQGPGLPAYSLGEEAGSETVTLIANEMPAHTHLFAGTTAAATTKRPSTGAALAKSTLPNSTSPGNAFYGTAQSLTALQPGTIGLAGGSQPHSNMQPYLVISWCICIVGVFPARN
jgi:microcystin-dependent protein